MDPKKNSKIETIKRFFIRLVMVGIMIHAILIIQSCNSKTETEQKEIVLEVLDPCGTLVSPEVTGLSNDRISDLNGKKIALMADKPDAIVFFNSMETEYFPVPSLAVVVRSP